MTWSLSLPGASHQFGPTILSKTDMAYWHLRQTILDGTLAPGSRLDQEVLAAGLGLSTTPVREALRRLESEHLVVGRAHREMIVTELSAELLAQTYAVRLNLDPLAVSMAAEEAKPSQLDAIGELARRAPSEDPGEQLLHNRALHRSIYAACGNAVLIELLDLLWDRSDRYRFITLEERRDTTGLRDEHVAIADAVAARDAELAAQLMTAHILASHDRISHSPRFANGGDVETKTDVAVVDTIGPG